MHVLRTLADSNALIASAAAARRCVVVGASFIGLEVAAALRNRGLEVDVVAPEERPMERVMGAAIGEMVRAIHEQHGVRFRLGATVAAIAEHSVTLSTGQQLMPIWSWSASVSVPQPGLQRRRGLASIAASW